ncbi:ParB/RepB/Spo0J family partition protein [Blastococcus goldschmidtiae]|uniref:ParB/RepB/Spo0J family partition protein n=1 Tax=Blastococcus goldschmidtiae TaxID=3075546 RepID=A0ABU2K2K7_9ACTN|nr:ParB/RepB/Spo0J family partition protein [Blastococcus sp. DSM 46792]MDT0274406.1 ParB/RepB/Spo0J family partition protein [Blastococcus sp. DSM 46792]
MSKRGGLGRGLAALIPTGPPPSAPTAPPQSTEPADRSGADESPSTAAPSPVSLVPPPAEPSTADRPTPDASDVPAAPAAAGVDVGIAPPVEAPGALGVPGAQLREVSVDDVVPNPKQPRQVFDDEALEELSHSVKEFGLLQPIVVRENPGADGGTVTYELIMGERRLRAARAAGLETVPAIVRDTTDDAMLRDALLENIHRVQLNPLEEAAAYQQLLEEFGATHEELASKIGRSRSQVTNTIRLMKLPVKVQTRVAAGVISAGHARALLGLPDADAQDALATRIVAEGMSVRATEEAVAMAAAERPTAKRRTRNISAPGVEELGSRLSDRFETKVKIQIGRSKGKIVVEFGSVDDLQRIIGVMAPEITGRRPEA